LVQQILKKFVEKGEPRVPIETSAVRVRWMIVSGGMMFWPVSERNTSKSEEIGLKNLGSMEDDKIRVT